MTIRTIIQSALLAAVMAVLSQITIPLPTGIPFTLQVFGVYLSIFLMGKKAFWAMATYLFLGIIGLPVFAQAQGGIGIVLGPTGGFITGFVISGLIGGYIVELNKFDMKGKILGLIVSLIIIYFIGIAQFAFVTKSSINESLTIASLLPLDILKGIIAIILSKYIGRALYKAGVNING